MEQKSICLNTVGLEVDIAEFSNASVTRKYERKRSLLSSDDDYEIDCNYFSKFLDSNSAEEVQYTWDDALKSHTEQDCLTPIRHQSGRTSVSSSYSTISNRIIQMDSPSKTLFKEQSGKLRFQVRSLRRKILSQKSKINRLRSKTKNLNFKTSLNQYLKNKSNHVKTFVWMQLLNKKRINWTREQKEFALSLYYKSPGAYKFMIQKLGFNMPALRTIQFWLKVTNLRTGLDTNLSKRLICKAQTMTEKEKICAVLFDELSLKPKLEYNQSTDLIEGYEDLGSLGRNNKIANTALVFFIRGLIFNWKIPLCYFVSHGPVKGNILKNIVEHVILTLKKMTFIPVALVCDQASSNRNAFQLLGATKDNPTINISGSQLFTIFDVPHLIKSLRNNFMNEKLDIFVNNNLVSWSDVVQTYKVDKNSNISRALTKISDTHIFPNTFQKMKVKYATQLFSHTMAATILTCAKTKQLTSKTAYSTAAFIESINNLFDCLNSRILHDANPNKRPLSVFNSRPEIFIEEGITLFKNIIILENGKRRNNIYCIEGFLWTLKSILMLWNFLKNNWSIKYLLTSFLNQDPLENFFSVIRNRGGYNPTPSVKQCRIAIQHNMNIRLLAVQDNGNCEIRSDEEILDLGESPIEPLDPPNLQRNADLESAENYKKDQQEILSPPNTNTSQSLETCVTIYVAGYLLFKLHKKINCNECKLLLSRGDNNDLSDTRELFLLFKDFGVGEGITALTRPSEKFTSLIIHLLDVFNKLFEQFKLDTNVATNIFNAMNSFVLKEHSWFYEPIITYVAQATKNESRNKVNLSMNGLNFVRMSYGNKNLLFLIDTGASISIIFKSSLTGKEIVDSSKKTKVNGIAGSIDSDGSTRMCLCVKDIIVCHEFLVLNDFINSVHGIIGTDFFTKFSAILDFEKYTFRFNIGEKEITIPMETSQGLNTTTIPPRCEVIKYVRVNEWDDCLVVQLGLQDSRTDHPGVVELLKKPKTSFELTLVNEDTFNDIKNKEFDYRDNNLICAPCRHTIFFKESNRSTSSLRESLRSLEFICAKYDIPELYILKK
ncbi:hypothetical protein FQR65_LT14453 [Abscondita terminalis]|nr:hypothetical protein FQR65_LT14453 [Abscondita terminalis]